jgi:N-hydroxyarylamine O-acetyltransferase
MDLDGYLERIRYAGHVAPTAEVLRDLHRHHLLAVPFENLDIPLRREITLDLERIYDKLVRHRRGGFCYEQNGLFAWALRAIGFDLDLLAARVARPDGTYSPEFAHMLLLVRAEGERWLADVGFGDSFVEPLRLDVAGPQLDRGLEYQVTPAGEEFLLRRREDGKLEEKFRFSLEARELVDYAAMCVFQQTSPESHFTRRRVCSLATAGGRITLTATSFLVTAHGRKTETPLASEADFERLLQQHFGIALSGFPPLPPA